MEDNPHPWSRKPLIVSFPNDSKYTETYGFYGSSGSVNLEGQLFVPEGKPSKTLLLFMHPSSSLNLLPMPNALASAGMHVLCAQSRYPKNDSALIMENVVIDMGAWIRYAREVEKYETIVLAGWSGGGSLSLFYQAQAEHPTITATPAGDEVDLTQAALPRADAIIFIASHLSRAETLTEWLDPSVRNEIDPSDRDSEFDIYSEDCPHKPPYAADFVERFRAAQVARNRRITAWCQEKLADLRKRAGHEVEHPFIVYRTMCDVRWIDPNVDPNERKPDWCYLGDPRTANVIPAGLARYTSLRSWLSQWSYDLSNAKSTINAPLIRETPVLLIENAADDAVPATHVPRVHQLLGTDRKEYVTIDGANHYYLGQPEKLQECVGHIESWCSRSGFDP